MTALAEQITAANDRAKLLDDVARDALAKANRAWAEALRLTLLDVLAEHPAILSFSYEVEYAYDDEGGYFPTASVTTHWQPGHDDDEDCVDDQVADECCCYGRDALALLTGGDPERSGEITADELRALDPVDVPDAPEGSYAAVTGCPT